MLPWALIREAGVTMSSLQEAIDSSLGWAAAGWSSEASVVITMHAELGIWLGIAQPGFLSDVPLRDAGPVQVETETATGIGRLFEKQPAPGYSTRGYAPHLISTDTNYFREAQTDFTYTNQIWMDFSVRKDPGVPILQYARWGPKVQIEIETFAVYGTAVLSAVKLDAVEDGGILRAAGPSLANPGHRANYTVTLEALWIGPG
jgi:hypothetical protein